MKGVAMNYIAVDWKHTLPKSPVLNASGNGRRNAHPNWQLASNKETAPAQEVPGLFLIVYLLRRGPDLLQNAELIGTAPALHLLAVLKARDLHSACADGFAGRWNAHEVAGMGSSQSVREGHVVVIGDEMVDGHFHVGERGAEHGEKLDKAFRADALIRGGVMVHGVRGHEVPDGAQMAAVDGLAEGLLRFDIVLLTHKRSPIVSCVTLVIARIGAAETFDIAGPLMV